MRTCFKQASVAQATDACLGDVENASFCLLRVEQSSAFSEDTLRRMMPSLTVP